MRRDPVIIGAGPAGCAAAITLARGGYQPVLIERLTGPSHKVCGDFLGPDTIVQAQALGCDPAALGAVPIRRLRLRHARQEAEADLPFPALSLTRRAFDSALLTLAKEAGANVQLGKTMRCLDDAVFLATGKHDIGGLPRPGAGDGAIGMKMYFALTDASASALGDATELTLFPGGYAGVQPVENGCAVLCVAITQKAFRRVGRSWDDLIAAIASPCPAFGDRLKDARPTIPRPIAVARIPYGMIHGGRDGIFRLGDQAAVIPSLTGDGLAIALHSGRIAAETWLNGGGANTYHHQLRRMLGLQMRIARSLHQACMTGGIQAIALHLAKHFPSLVTVAARHTRLHPQAI